MTTETNEGLNLAPQRSDGGERAELDRLGRNFRSKYLAARTLSLDENLTDIKRDRNFREAMIWMRAAREVDSVIQNLKRTVPTADGQQ